MLGRRLPVQIAIDNDGVVATSIRQHRILTHRSNLQM